MKEGELSLPPFVMILLGEDFLLVFFSSGLGYFRILPRLRLLLMHSVSRYGQFPWKGLCSCDQELYQVLS